MGYRTPLVVSAAERSIEVSLRTRMSLPGLVIGFRTHVAFFRCWTCPRPHFSGVEPFSIHALVSPSSRSVFFALHPSHRIFACFPHFISCVMHCGGTRTQHNQIAILGVTSIVGDESHDAWTTSFWDPNTRNSWVPFSGAMTHVPQHRTGDTDTVPKIFGI